MLKPTNSSEPYMMPETFGNMTIHHLYGFTPQSEDYGPTEYLLKNEFAFLADLVATGFVKDQIEGAVNSFRINVATWPKVESITDFFWVEGEGLTRLKELADQAVKLCFGGADEPVGGNFATVGAEMGSQQMALAGLIYGREQGLLREIVELSDGAGPLYVVRDSFSGQMFDQVLPEVSN